MKSQLPIPLKFNPRIKGSDYIRILGTNSVISRFETTKGHNYQETHFALSDKRKYMPSARLFMPYYSQVIKANEGLVKLCDANNHPIPSDEVEELYKKLTSDSWTRLNNYFIQDNLGRLLNESFMSFKKQEDKQIITLERDMLEQCVMEDYVVDLEFNKQGFPVRKSNEQDYIRGKNIKFWYPRKDSVARFFASSVRALLDCSGNPSDSFEGLGVFECAEGAPKN